MTALARDYARMTRLMRLRDLLRLDSLLARTWRRIPLGSYQLRGYFDAVQKPQYAYGVLSAARLAKALGHARVAVCEFGVAGGRGLLALEQAAMAYGRLFEIEIAVFGFDSGAGLPAPRDYRDNPYWWQAGLFPMDAEALRARLRKAELILGAVAETLPDFVARLGDHPLGFCAFDLDFCSSTEDAFVVFAGGHASRLPRVACYMDDVVGSDMTPMNRHVGQLHAIEAFNAAHDRVKISQVAGLAHKRIVRAQWNDQIYVFDDFDHPDYSRPIRAAFDPGTTLDL